MNNKERKFQKDDFDLLLVPNLIFISSGERDNYQQVQNGMSLLNDQ